MPVCFKWLADFVCDTACWTASAEGACEILFIVWVKTVPFLSCFFFSEVLFDLFALPILLFFRAPFCDKWLVDFVCDFPCCIKGALGVWEILFTVWVKTVPFLSCLFLLEVLTKPLRLRRRSFFFKWLVDLVWELACCMFMALGVCEILFTVCVKTVPFFSCFLFFVVMLRLLRVPWCFKRLSDFLCAIECCEFCALSVCDILFNLCVVTVPFFCFLLFFLFFFVCFSWSSFLAFTLTTLLGLMSVGCSSSPKMRNDSLVSQLCTFFKPNKIKKVIVLH